MKNWIWWFLAGVLSLLGGFFAWANPFAATVTAELLAGWTLVFVGVTAVFSAFGEGQRSRVGAVLLGVATLLLGVYLLMNPLKGIISLTLAVAVILVMAGVFRIVLAFSVAGGARWALVFSGAISLLLSALIFSNFPQSAAVMLGIFLAVELVCNGVSLMMLALARKNLASPA